MRLALREIRRTKLRFSLLAGAVGLLVFLILFQSTLLSTLLSFFSGALGSQSGTVVVYSEDARKNPEGSILPLATVDAVAGVPGVGAAGPFGVDTMTARAGGEELDVALLGYRLDGPGRPTTLVSGRLPRDGGEGVASDIDADRGFAVGDTVRIVGPDGTLPIRIVGLTRHPVQRATRGLRVVRDVRGRGPWVKNPDALAILPSMVVATPDLGVAPSTVADRITRSVAGVDALSRADALAQLPGVAAVNSSFSIIQGLAFVVVTLVVGIFFVILTVQKAAALTLLRAIGASSGRLVRSLLAEVLLVMVGGIVIGAGLLLLASLGSSPDFPIGFDVGIVVTRGVVLVVLAAIASLAAIRRVLRIDPIAATVPAGVER